MESFYKDNVHGAIIHDTRREKKDETYPVKFRITHQRQRIYFKAGYDLTVEEWNILPTSRKGYLLDA
ncbi:MAG: Arm DNA-binding domain-containing protein, partial [Bacteroidales bacterium]